MKKRISTLLLFVMAIVSGYAQIIPVKIINNSHSDFNDDEIYIGIIGQNKTIGPLYYDLKNNNANDAGLRKLTTGCNTLHKVAGDQGYADVFTRLSDIKDKTIYMDKTFACRMFIGFKRPMYMHVNDNNGGYAGANLQNPTDPNLGQRFEFVEFTYNDAGLWINTTRVDAYEYPMGLEEWGTPDSNVKYTKVGETISHKDILSRWQSQNAGNIFSQCLINNITTDNLGGIIMQPSKVESVRNTNYFDDYINRIWNAFSTKELYADMGELGKWKGRVENGVFKLTAVEGTYTGKTATVTRPTTTDVIEGAGAFATNHGSDRDMPVQAMFCGAMNRGMINTNLASGELQNWGDVSKFFKQDIYNPYVEFFHQNDISYNSKTYAFAYDDTFGQSSTCYTNKPSNVTITIGGFLGMPDNTPTTTTIDPAPKPTQDAANVKSIYSDAYTPKVKAKIGSWNQTTTTSEVSLNDGSKAYYNTNFNYLGFQFDTDNTFIDATDMQYLHLDVYPESSFTMNVYPIFLDASGNKNDQVSKAVNLQANKWNQIDIPLSAFNGLNASKIFQIKLDGGDKTQKFYIDNIYFYSNTATKISNISVNTKKASADIYNLNGQIVRHAATNASNLPKGVYIWNGKKFVVK